MKTTKPRKAATRKPKAAAVPIMVIEPSAPIFTKRKAVAAILGVLAITSWSSALLLSGNVDVIHTAKPVSTVALQAPRETYPINSDVWQSRSGLTLAHTGREVSFLSSRMQPAVPEVLGAETTSTSDLTQEQAIDLDKPGVVSIINWFDGQASIPDFDVDLKTFALTPRKDLSPYVLKADWALTGSGFVVNPDGYIITNAHVISKNTVMAQLSKDISDHWNDLYQSEQDALTDKQFNSYQKYLDATFGTGADSTAKINSVIDQQVTQYIQNNTTDNSTNSIVVVDKAMKNRTLVPGGEIEQIFKGGLSAKVVDFDKNYATSGKDVALLKVDETNLPALPLGSSSGLVSGQKTLIFGYPSNARISDSDFFEPTLTEGVVGAIKDDSGRKIIQLDNKISPGSSGGPLLDIHGNVVGITTYETAQSSDSQGGDNFGFAQPIEVAKDLMVSNSVTNDLGVYGSNLLLGISSQGNSVCQKALGYFTSAEGTNSHFPVKDELDPHMQACQSLITSNMSKDTLWDMLRIFYSEHQINAIIFTLLILAALGFVGIVLWRLAKRNRSQPNMDMPMIPTPRQMA